MVSHEFCLLSIIELLYLCIIQYNIQSQSKVLSISFLKVLEWLQVFWVRVGHEAGLQLTVFVLWPRSFCRGIITSIQCRKQKGPGHLPHCNWQMWQSIQNISVDCESHNNPDYQVCQRLQLKCPLASQLLCLLIPNGELKHHNLALDHGLVWSRFSTRHFAGAAFSQQKHCKLKQLGHSIVRRWQMGSDSTVKS